MNEVLQSFRAKYPQYDQIGDDDLIDRLGQKFPAYLEHEGFKSDYDRVQMRSLLTSPTIPLPNPEETGRNLEARAQMEQRLNPPPPEIPGRTSTLGQLLPAVFAPSQESEEQLARIQQAQRTIPNDEQMRRWKEVTSRYDALKAMAARSGRMDTYAKLDRDWRDELINIGVQPIDIMPEVKLPKMTEQDVRTLAPGLPERAIKATAAAQQAVAGAGESFLTPEGIAMATGPQALAKPLGAAFVGVMAKDATKLAGEAAGHYSAGDNAAGDKALIEAGSLAAMLGIPLAQARGKNAAVELARELNRMEVQSRITPDEAAQIRLGLPPRAQPEPMLPELTQTQELVNQAVLEANPLTRPIEVPGQPTVSALEKLRLQKQEIAEPGSPATQRKDVGGGAAIGGKLSFLRPAELAMLGRTVPDVQNPVIVENLRVGNTETANALAQGEKPPTEPPAAPLGEPVPKPAPKSPSAETIVAASLRDPKTGEMWSDISHSLAWQHVPNPANRKLDAGFITSQGRWVNRDEAGKIAKKPGRAQSIFGNFASPGEVNLARQATKIKAPSAEKGPNAIQEQSANESLLRQERPEVGLQEMARGELQGQEASQAAPQETVISSAGEQGTGLGPSAQTIGELGASALPVKTTPEISPPNFSKANAPELEGGMKALSADAKFFEDVASTKSFSEKGLGGLDVPTQRAVMSRVIARAKDPQIFNSVVQSVPIDVVNNLIRPEGSPNVRLHDKSVLSDILAVNLDKSVSIRSDVAETLFRAVADSAAKLVSASGKVGPVSVKNLPANAARGEHEPSGALKEQKVNTGIIPASAKTTPASPATKFGDGSEIKSHSEFYDEFLRVSPQPKFPRARNVGGRLAPESMLKGVKTTYGKKMAEWNRRQQEAYSRYFNEQISAGKKPSREQVEEAARNLINLGRIQEAESLIQNFGYVKDQATGKYSLPEPSKTVTPEVTEKSALDRANEWADRVLGEDPRKKTRAGLDPTEEARRLAAVAIKGAVFIRDGVTQFKDWSARMISEFGDSIKPHLDALWQQSKVMAKRGAAAIAREQRKLETPATPKQLPPAEAPPKIVPEREAKAMEAKVEVAPHPEIGKLTEQLNLFNQEIGNALESGGQFLPKPLRPSVAKGAPAQKATVTSKAVNQYFVNQLITIRREFNRVQGELAKSADPESQQYLKLAKERFELAFRQVQELRRASHEALYFWNQIKGEYQAIAETLGHMPEIKRQLPVIDQIVKDFRDKNYVQAGKHFIDYLRMNLFTAGSWTLDFGTNSLVAATRLPPFLVMDAAHLLAGRPAYRMATALRALALSGRNMLPLPRYRLADPIEQRLGTTAGGELVGQGKEVMVDFSQILPERPDLANKLRHVDKVIAAPVRMKRAVDNFFGRLGATAELYNMAYVEGRKQKLRGDELKVFVENFVNNPPENAIAKSVEVGNEFKFNRELSQIEEKIASNVGVKLFAEAFPRWTFQFARWAGEMVGADPKFARKLLTAKATPEETLIYITKALTGWGAIYAFNSLFYNNIDANTMEYVDEHGNRTRLSGRTPVPELFFVNAVLRGDWQKAKAALAQISLPGARLLSGEPAGLLSPFIDAMKESIRGRYTAERTASEMTKIVNDMIPGKSMLGLIRSIHDPSIREGIGSPIPGVAELLPSRVNPTTGETLAPRQRIPGTQITIPTVAGTPFPGAVRVLNDVEKALTDHGLATTRPRRTSLIELPAEDVPKNVRREYEQIVGKNVASIVGDGIKDKNWKELPFERRREVLQMWLEISRKMARAEIAERHGASMRPVKSLPINLELLPERLKK